MIRKSFLVYPLLGVFLGVSCSYFFLIPVIFFSYYFFLKKIFLETKLQDSFKAGWLFGIGFYLGSMYWIISPFLIYERHILLSPVSIFFPLGMGLFFAIPSMLITIFNENFLFFRQNKLFLKAFSISFFFFLAEIIKSKIFGGLPLNLSAHIWAFNEIFIKISKYVGVFGLSFLTILWIVLLCLFFEKKKIIRVAILFVAFPLFLFSLNFLPDNKRNIYSNEVLVRIVQPNIPQKDKWNKLMFEKNFEKLISLTTENNNIEEKKIVIWPEVALTYFINEEEELIEFLKTKIPKNITIVMGGLRRVFSDEKFNIYNSLYVLNDNNLIFYDKKKLVPFGEFVPFRGFLNLFKLTPGTTDFSEGSIANEIKINLNNQEVFFEPSICYEAIFQTFGSNNSSLMINITNDAWFGNTVGPKQHLAAQVFRSVEKSVYFLRSANSGISAALDNSGKILKKIDLNSFGYFDIKIAPSLEKTIFEKYGNVLVFFLITAICLLFYLIEFFITLKR